MEMQESLLLSESYNDGNDYRILQDVETEFNITETTNSTAFLSSSMPSWAPSRAPTPIPSARPSISPTINPFVHSTDAIIIKETFRVYGSLYLVFFISFCIVRQKANKYMNIRSWVPEIQTERATNAQYGFISWSWKVFAISDDELLETCGMDALCFLRCLRLGFKFSLMGSFNAMWLIPLYVTAESSPETDLLTDPFVRMSVANLPIESLRFIGTIVATYITNMVSLYLVTIEYDWYTKYRHKYLSQRKPRNYAIYVSGIPEEQRSSYALADFFRQCTSWRGAVYEAHVTMDIPSLESKVSRRNLLVEKIVHIAEKQRKTGSTTTHHTIHQLFRGKGMKRVDSMKAFTDELIDLNATIALEVGRITRSNHRMRQHLAKLPPSRTLNVGSDDTTEMMEELSDQPPPPMTQRSSSQRRLSSFPTSFRRRVLGDGMTSSYHMEYISDMEHGSLPSECEEEERDEGSRSSPVVEASLVDGINISDESNSTEEAESTRAESRWQQQQQTKPVSNTSLFIKDEGSKDDLNFGANDLSEGAVFEDPSLDTELGGNRHDILDIIEEAELDLISPNTSRDNHDHEIDEPASTPAVAAPVSLLKSPRSSKSNVSWASRLSPDNKKASSRLSNESTSSWALGSTIRSTSNSVSTSVKSGVKKVSERTSHVGGQVKKVSKKGVSTVKAAGSIAGSGVKLAAELGLNTIQQAPDLGKTVGASLVASAAAVVPLRFGRSEGQPREAGFVVFRDLYTAQAARQMLQHYDPSCMLVKPAPDPEEIFWRNVGLPAESIKTGRTLSTFASSVLCLFWSIPMAFFSSLTEINSLKEKLPGLGRLTEKYDSLESFFALLAPLLLLTMNEAVLPMILRYFATWEGHVGASLLDASLFFKLCAFVIIQAFFVSALTGTITAELANFLDNPEKIVDLLANSLPAQSSYFIQICLVFTFLLQGLDLIRAYPLGVAFLRRFCFGPNLTKEERRRSWGWFSSLEDPPDFWHAELLAQIMLFFVVFFVYSVIAPITSPFLMVCFLILESGYRYHFVHNQKPTPDSGGKLWPGFVRVLIASQLIGLCTLFGLLVLRRTVYALPALLPCGAATILFAIFVIPRRHHVANFLPTVLCAQVDKRFQEAGDNVKYFAAKSYLQPALKAEQVYPDGFEIPRVRIRTMSIEGTR